MLWARYQCITKKCFSCHGTQFHISDTYDLVGVSFESTRDIVTPEGPNHFNLLVDVTIGGAGAEGSLPVFTSDLYLSVDDIFDPNTDFKVGYKFQH